MSVLDPATLEKISAELGSMPPERRELIYQAIPELSSGHRKVSDLRELPRERPPESRNDMAPLSPEPPPVCDSASIDPDASTSEPVAQEDITAIPISEQLPEPLPVADPAAPAALTDMPFAESELSVVTTAISTTQPVPDPLSVAFSTPPEPGRSFSESTSSPELDSFTIQDLPPSPARKKITKSFALPRIGPPEVAGYRYWALTAGLCLATGIAVFAATNAWHASMDERAPLSASTVRTGRNTDLNRSILQQQLEQQSSVEQNPFPDLDGKLTPAAPTGAVTPPDRPIWTSVDTKPAVTDSSTTVKETSEKPVTRARATRSRRSRLRRAQVSGTRRRTARRYTRRARSGRTAAAAASR